jgi:hypothetical protein
MPGKTRADPEKRSTFQRYMSRMGAHPFAREKALAEGKWGPEVSSVGFGREAEHPT